MAPRLGKYTTQLGGPSLLFRGHASCIHYTVDFKLDLRSAPTSLHIKVGRVNET
jgi:hypothetical protein